ncbi:MAG TPA: ATP-binding protein [Oligoflexus sp.]|uniref:ATP-binding protein n=1 Tax=Oligoflexus sp. TaxID=1971216 RepID=UPI002D7F2CD7|nr:ATP-binding protein [Oligoflexus sp.]HET9238300.1 ATP-binding protein [Oligoflexus sp.]
MKILYLLILALMPVKSLALAYQDIRLVDGQADLSASGPGIYRMTGDVLWIWDKLLMPGDPALDSMEKVPFPKLWHGHPEQSRHKIGKATYSLRLILPLEAFGEVWGLRLPRIYGASRVWVNGVELPNPSQIDPKGTQHTQITASFIHYFRIQSETLDIVVQNANSQVQSGGFDWDMLVAPADLLQELLAKLSFMDAAILGSLLFAAVYHIWLYSFRRQWLPYLILGLFFFVAMLRIAVTGAGQWGLGFHLPEVLHRRMELITYYLLVLISLYNVEVIYRRNCFVSWNRMLYSLGGAVVVITAVSAPTFAQRFLQPFHILTLCIFGTMMQIVVLSMIRKTPGSLLFFSGMMVAIACSVVDLLYVLQIIYLPFFIVGPGLMVFALLACLFQAFRFEQIFQTLETQNRDISQLNQNLSSQAQALESRVRLVTQELNAILQHTDAGIILFIERDGAVDVSPMVSQAGTRMLGAESLGVEDFARFLSRSKLDGHQQAQTMAALSASLGIPSFLFDMNRDLLPDKLEITEGSDAPRVYICSWLPQVEGELVSGVLLILIDVSSEAIGSARFDQQHQRIMRFSELLSLDSVKLQMAIPECGALLDRMRLALRSALQKDQEDWKAGLMRDLHTFKGLSRAFGFKHLARVTHEAEERLIHESSLDVIAETLGAVRNSYDNYARDYHIIFKIEGNGRLLDDGHLAERFLRAAQRIAQSPPDEAWKKEWTIVQRSYFIPLSDLVTSFRSGLVEIAAQLGKPTPSLQIEGAHCLLKRSLLGAFSGIFIHLLRNALDHGIEAPDLRRLLGKSHEGTIAIHSQLEAEHLILDVYDDGKGLDLNRVHERARLKAYVQDDRALSDDDIAGFIFMPGFSTKDEASDVSGRGVGMDAVRSMIEELGGSLQVIWREARRADGYRACIWRISLPRGVCLEEAV